MQNKLDFWEMYTYLTFVTVPIVDLSYGMCDSSVLYDTPISQTVTEYVLESRFDRDVNSFFNMDG